jgi:hypothetical protein
MVFVATDVPGAGLNVNWGFPAGRNRGSELCNAARRRAVPEKRARAAKSVFQFHAYGSVANARTRRRLGTRIHFWPFGGWEIPAGRSAIVGSAYDADKTDPWSRPVTGHGAPPRRVRRQPPALGESL